MAGLPGNNEGIKNRLPISNIFDFQTNISHLKGIPLENCGSFASGIGGKTEKMCELCDRNEPSSS